MPALPLERTIQVSVGRLCGASSQVHAKCPDRRQLQCLNLPGGALVVMLQGLEAPRGARLCLSFSLP